MAPIADLIFFFSLFMILYVYLGYPLTAFFISLLTHRKVRKDRYEPYVTILIAAYNEESVIEQTLKNKLALDYPGEKLEIIIISDGSTDRTDAIVKGYEKAGARLIRQEPRAGKTSGLNRAAPLAAGEVLIFSDANSQYDKNAIRKLIENFNDPGVGYVTGKMIYTNPDGSTVGDGCSAYMKYENFLRKIETMLGSVVGVDGGIDAVRKELYRPMNPDQLPDFVLPLKVVEQGYRAVFEPEAILKEPSLKTAQDEYKMRVRVSLRALWALWDMRSLLTCSPSCLFSWQLWSHKILRYLSFIFLIAAFLSNLFLLNENVFYKTVFLAQCFAYIAGIFSPLLEKKGFKLKILYLINYFILLNLASAHAFVKFLMGQKMVTWTPRKG
jgi:cellulose synthase/poly-beta-1,6-N-acetylglucosamine synthase-like glycosyltransferase